MITKRRTIKLPMPVAIFIINVSLSRFSLTGCAQATNAPAAVARTCNDTI